MGQQRAELGEQVVPGSDLNQEEAAFFLKFDQEYERLSNASDRFKTDLPEGLLTLKSLVSKRQSLEKELKKLKKPSKSKKSSGHEPDLVATRVAELTQELDQVYGEISQIQNNLPTLFKPWTDKINQQKKEIVDSFSDVQIDIDVDGVQQVISGDDLLSIPQKFQEVAEQLQLEKIKLNKDQGIIRSQLKRRKLSKEDKQNLVTLQAQQAEQAMTIDINLQKLVALSPKKRKYDQLSSLDTALTTNKKFIFVGESNVQNPSVLQLITKGFFTPDQEVKPGGAES
jgi:hypothetical protein